MPDDTPFPYGVSYSPLFFDEQEWKNDLSQMQANHLNVIRIGDVHGSWDRIEPREGEFRFDILGRFYAAAARFGMQILMATGTSSPPLWLAIKFPDVSILSSRGERYPLGASYHWACIHHPDFLQAAEAYIRQLARFAVQHPNHFGWQISNEIGFPFMPAREKEELGLYCYCSHCQQAFRNWAKAKYGDLQALTAAWSWSTTSFVYNQWEDIFAPESLPASWAGVTRWIDWRSFWQDAFAHFAGWQHQILRAVDASHPTSVNTFSFKGYDRFGTYMGLDQWKIAAQVDHIGYDLYPGSGDKLKSRPEHNSMFLDHGRSVAASSGREFWIHEIESGPIGGWVLGPEHNTDAVDIHNNGMEALGHAAKLILYMPWREWGYQPIRWGALVDLGGRPTPRLESAGQLGRFIQDNRAFLKEAQVVPGEVALLESKPNAIFFRGVDQEELLFAAQRGVYRAFWERGFSIDFITPHHLKSEGISRFRYICLPLLGLLSDEDAALLEGYVRRGGILIGFSRCATLDGHGWYHHRLPVPGLAAAFGLEHIEADTLDDAEIQFNGQVYQGWLNRDVIEPRAGTEVLASFKDGSPAVTLARHGQGSGLYIATQADSGYLRPGGQVLGEVVRMVNDRLRISPHAWLEGEAPRADGIDHHVLETRQRTMVLFSNYLARDAKATFHLDTDRRQPRKIMQSFPLQAELEGTTAQGRLHIPLEFHGKEVKGIDINWT